MVNNLYSACQQPPQKYREPRAAKNRCLLGKHTGMLLSTLNQQVLPPFLHLSRLNLHTGPGNSCEPQTKDGLSNTETQAQFHDTQQTLKTQP